MPSINPRYLQIICPMTHVDLYRLAAARFSDSKFHDNNEYTDYFRMTTDGLWLIENHPAGPNMRLVAAAIINDSIPASAGIFDALRMDRGIHAPLSDVDIQTLRDVCIIAVNTNMTELLAANGLEEYFPPPPDTQ